MYAEYRPDDQQRETLYQEYLSYFLFYILFWLEKYFDCFLHFVHCKYLIVYKVF